MADHDLISQETIKITEGLRESFQDYLRAIDLYCSEMLRTGESPSYGIIEGPKIKICDRVLDLCGLPSHPPSWEEVHEVDRKRRQPGLEPIESAGVYILRASDLFKIGATSNLKKRVATIRGQVSGIVELVHFYLTQTPFHLEKKLHVKYRQYRHHGEWFSLPPSAVEEIRTLEVL